MTPTSTPRRREHLDPEDLLGIAEGARPSAAARTHLERCEPCRTRLSDTESLLGDLRGPALPEPPPALVRSVIESFPRQPPLAERVLESVASLLRGGVAGAGLSPAMAGLRGAAAAPSRLLYHAPGFEIDLELSHEERGVRVTGQVLASDSRKLPVLAWVEARGQMLGEAPVSGFGTFVLEPFAAASFDLVLDLGEQRLRLEVKTPGGSGAPERLT